MKKNLKSALFIGLLFAGLACSKKEDPKPVVTTITDPNAPAADASPLSSTESDALVSRSATQFSSDLNSINATKSIKAMNSLSSLSLPSSKAISVGRLSFSPGNSISAQLISQFRSSIIRNKVKSNRMELGSPLNQYQGVYVYDPTTGDFLSPTVSDNIVFIFPDSINKAKGVEGTNNCQLTVSSFEEIVLGADSTTYPTKFFAQLTIDGTKEMAVEYTAAFTNDGKPTSLVASIEIVPIKLSENFSYNTGKASFSTLLENTATQKKIFGYGISLEGNLDTEEVNSAEGYVFIDDLAITGFANVKALMDAEASQQIITSDFVNQNLQIKMKSYSKGNVIASLKYDDKITKGDRLFVVYEADNSNKKTLDQFFEAFLAQLEGLDIGYLLYSVNL